MWWPGHRRRDVVLRIAPAAALFLPFSLTGAEHRGFAELAARGYYQAFAAGRLEHISGLSFRFSDFVPRLGILTGSLESYRHLSGNAFGDTYLELRGVPWAGRRWTAAGGDFRFATSLPGFPLHNLYYPDITARGIKLEASTQATQYTFFLGRGTLLGGPRVPFRVSAPQTMAGAAARVNVGTRLIVSGRLTRFWTSEKAMGEDRFLFPPGRDFRNVTSLALHSVYTPAKNLRLFAEAAPALSNYAGRNSRLPGHGLSFTGGVSWETANFTAQANYASLTASYLPLAGYFAGDRRGPFGEVRYRPFRRLELFASAGRYRNNLERNPELPTLLSTSTSSGVSVALPWRFSAVAQVSTIRLAADRQPAGAPRDSANRQLIASLARPLGRHSLRLTYHDMRLGSTLLLQRQRAAEIEDTVSYRRFTVSGAVRAQRFDGPERRDTLFLRGLAHARFHRLTLTAAAESGNDLVNRTLFLTNTLRTTSAGVAVALTRTLSFSADAFRYSLTTELNPESIFVLGGRGVGLSAVLGGLNQWNFYFQLLKQLSWGGGLPRDDVDRFTAEQAPLVGTIEGFVYERRIDGRVPAEGIPVTLDHWRTAVTGPDGRFRFPDVPEGVHKVALSASELPADFDPAPASEVAVPVVPRRTVRAELEVFPLAGFGGQVSVSEGTLPETLENIVVHLLPTGRYTTTDAQGKFFFYNVREGTYEVAVDEQTLPAKGVLTSSGRVAVTVRCGDPKPFLLFEFRIPKEEQPIRKIFERQSIPNLAKD